MVGDQAIEERARADDECAGEEVARGRVRRVRGEEAIVAVILLEIGEEMRRVGQGIVARPVGEAQADPVAARDKARSSRISSAPSSSAPARRAAPVSET